MPYLRVFCDCLDYHWNPTTDWNPCIFFLHSISLGICALDHPHSLSHTSRVDHHSHSSLCPISVGVSQLSYILNTQWFIFHVLDSLLFIFCVICLMSLCIKVQKYVFVFILHTQQVHVWSFKLLSKANLSCNTDRNKCKPWWIKIDGQISRR